MRQRSFAAGGCSTASTSNPAALRRVRHGSDTGYASNATAANGFLKPDMEIITMPFAIKALATRIRSMIQVK
jgi:hypothetical protein